MRSFTQVKIVCRRKTHNSLVHFSIFQIQQHIKQKSPLLWQNKSSQLISYNLIKWNTQFHYQLQTKIYEFIHNCDLDILYVDLILIPISYIINHEILILSNDHMFSANKTLLLIKERKIWILGHKLITIVTCVNT